MHAANAVRAEIDGSMQVSAPQQHRVITELYRNGRMFSGRRSHWCRRRFNTVEVSGSAQ